LPAARQGAISSFDARGEASAFASLQTRHHCDGQRLRVRGVVSLRDELFEQLPLTFHA